MFDNVIDLGEPLFFNTLDGATKKDYYTKENILEMTILGSGNLIGELAILNSGLQNKIKTFPYLDTRKNIKYYTYEDLLHAINKEVCAMKEIPIENIINYRDKYLQDLFNKKVIVDTMDIMSEQEQKQYIIDRHRKYKYEEFLVLIAQQMAIDTSKTGYKVNQRIINKIRESCIRPYFICYTEKNREEGTYTNNPLDRFARNNNKYLSSKKSEVLNNIVIGEKIEKQFKDDKYKIKNKNYCRTIIMKSSENKFNIENVKMIINKLKPLFDDYKKFRQNINYEIVEEYIYKSESRIKYNILDNKFKQKLLNMIKYCSNDNELGFTIFDFMYSLYKLKFEDEHILKFVPNLLIKAICEVYEEVEVIKEGKYKNSIREFEYNNNVYSIVKQKLNVDKVSTNINNIGLKVLNNSLQKQNMALKLQVPINLVLENNKKYKLVANEVQEYLWSIYFNGELICNNARVIKCGKDYKAIKTLESSKIELLNISKSKKYRNYIIQ